ncbi:unnamed protein product [Arabidopsis thaliana]|uniref:Cardiomyopathy-associated protein n=1 Tax=Arabidopsis thaliana TaxID=3702 RepID=Q9FKN5_ARATH|nr:cardiomyopathy-associated protein [Arabidopsis thaliana]NP_001318590.1 cardiomyopathy-associated protein [Arabidopsis thaliana]NP_197293.1 cardiomyopathy-associated protein [Arabidopsis thaliana]AED92484.1 cardiomyopathy-associated protein [Arabidopsis thaliana]AED92485.1 cardiomyopathy-associated protein [Arabidopsis thaliana]ANM68625.1 cardiomyopathy-associated protein [Arabidopsis thaliana]BAB11225.1 unnamed protein product [Arabidopsis thaliana]|eukprot:NP_001190328.1 cardiomyopathy-associated protein [Arabidopsis thaliana]
MISDRSEFRVQIRRLFMIMIRTSYKWICNHPFLLGFVAFLYYLHRYCPLLFAPLVTASPVLVCTFVLLGTILSFGEPNIPEIEKDPEIFHEAAPLRTEVSRDANVTVVDRGGDESFTVESFVGAEKVVLEDGNDDAERLVDSQFSEVEDDGRPFDYRPLVDETLDEIKRDTHVRFEEKAFILDVEKKGDREDEKLIENDGTGAEQSRTNGSLYERMDDQMDVSPVSPWRPMRHEEDEDDDADRDDSLDSGSDGAESSSPDASMTDIIPMLDELHPLLLSEAPTRGIVDGEGSDAASEGPHRSSSDEGMESDGDSESHGEEGDNENEDEEEDEEEEDEEEKQEKKEDKDDESKSAIKWTEADQRNVMDLGSLELERNQRLENLIARRRARHNMRLMAERNLIDFDSADIPFNMPPISTARHNPFDVSYDSYDDMPIPGSAPSIMFARRNPFDLPYEPNEEKPDLKGDGFQEEFSSQQPKDPMFRRHESFSVGPSMLGGPRHDRLRPFFVLERLANEGTSYYPFERQLSEVSESKVSSIPDTESVCTVLEDDEKKVDENNADRETKIAKVDMVSDNDEENNHSASDHDEENSHSASDHDEEKSHSSEDSDFDEQADSKKLHHDVAEIVLGSGETHHEQSDMMEGETSDKGKLDEVSDSDSSLSEKEEKIRDISEDEAMLISEQVVDLHEELGASSLPSFGELEINMARGVEDDYHHDEARAEESFITAHPSLDESAIHVLCGLGDGDHEEPVYDSSPPSGSRFPSFSSVSSDYKPDLPEKNGEEIEENEEKEREVYSESIGPEEIHSTSNETETRTSEVGENSMHVTGEASLVMREHSTPLEESPDVVHDIAETSVNKSVVEEIMYEEEEAQKQKDEVSPQTFNADIPIDSYASLSSGAVEYVETHSFNDEDVAQLEQEPVHSLVHDAEEETHNDQTMDIEVDSVNASAQNVGSEETSPSESDRELTWSDKSVVEQSSLEPGDDQVPTRAGPVSVVFSRNITFHEYHDAPEDTTELSCLTSDTSSSPTESPEYTTPMVGEGSRAEFFQEDIYEELDHVVERLEQLTDLHAISQSPPEIITEEADEIKEIDEGLLSELDSIGDFNVKEVVTDTEPGPSSIENAMNQAVVESMEKQPKSPQSDSRSGEIMCAVETKPSESSVDESSIDETNVITTSDVLPVVARSLEEFPQPSEPKEGISMEIISESVMIPTEATGPGNVTVIDEVVTEETKAETTEKEEEGEEEEESKPKEITKSDVLLVETRALEEFPKPSELKKGMAMEVISEGVVIPTKAAGPSNVTLSDEVVTEKAKAETTASNTDANVQSPESKETPENSVETIAEQKGK